MSAGASSLKHNQTHSCLYLQEVEQCFSTDGYVLDAGVPDEGDLILVHPGLQLQTGIFSKWRDDETEDQGDADKHSR